jgi:hypothetical protein
MASVLKVNTLTGVTTAGSIVVTGEGNSTTTNLQQGLSKCWARWNMSSTAANDDTFNISSFNDDATGKCTQTFSNNLGNTTYSILLGNGELSGGGNRGIGCNTPTTSTTKFFSFTFPSSGGSTANDVDLNCATWQGDLA